MVIFHCKIRIERKNKEISNKLNLPLPSEMAYRGKQNLGGDYKAMIEKKWCLRIRKTTLFHFFPLNMSSKIDVMLE